MQFDTPFRRVWRLLTPIIIYNVIVMAVSLVGSFIVSAQVMSSTTATDMNTLMEEIMIKAMEVSVPVTCISGLISLPIMWRMMRSDAKLRPMKTDVSSLKKWKLIYCGAAGIFGCIAGSILVTITRIGTVYNGYEEVSQNIFSQNLAVQLIAIGLVSPFVEEFIYRGLIYKRLRDYTTLNMALIISSVLFGLAHGNLVQGLYGFSMGLLMAYVYERYKVLAAPIICHGAANVISIIFQLFHVTVDSVYVAVFIALICLVGVYFMLRLIYQKVNVKMIPNENFIDVTAGMQNHRFYEDDAQDHHENNTQPHHRVEDYYPKDRKDD